MVKTISAEEILKKNPQISKEELDNLLKLVSATRSDKILGTYKVSHSPYFRPSVRIDKQSTPECKASVRRS